MQTRRSDSPTRVTEDSMLKDLREELSEVEDRHISQIEVADALGVNGSTYWRQENLPDEAVHPAYVLAMRQLIEDGFARERPKMPGTRFDKLVQSIDLLTISDISEALGISSSALYDLRTSDNTVPRFYVLAARYLRKELCLTDRQRRVMSRVLG